MVFKFLLLTGAVFAALAVQTAVPATAQPAPEWRRPSSEPLLVPPRRQGDIRDNTRDRPRYPGPRSPSDVDRSLPRDRRAALPMCSPARMDLDAPNGGRCFSWGAPQRLERKTGAGAPCFLTVRQCKGYTLNGRRIYL